MSHCFSSRRLAAGHQHRAGIAVAKQRAKLSCRSNTAASATTTAQDKWLAKNVVPLFPAADSASSQIQALQDSCRSALTSLRMPSTRNEEYRFTEITGLLAASLTPAAADAAVSAQQLSQLKFPEAAGSRAVLVNGVYRADLSDVTALPQGAYVGTAAGGPAGALAQLGTLSNTSGGPFAVLNGSLVQDVLIVSLPSGAHIHQPMHVLHISTASVGAATAADSSSKARVLAASAPRLLISLADGAACEVVEEYVSAAAAQGSHVSMPLAEVVLGPGASFKHGYVNREAQGAIHFKATLVAQAERSCYQLTEARVGGSLTRHDLGIHQLGPDTTTSMKHFLLAGAGQLQDLHSKLVLNHPRGQANQLHKCIASAATGRGVFDGNVKVNRFAQKTDACQLSRNLLLVPKATVNVKPNLQIVADDVKCTHGCTVSDLSEEELFYFRARGVSYEQARQALVYSFGAEVVQDLQYDKLVGRIQQDVVDSLKKTVEDA